MNRPLCQPTKLYFNGLSVEIAWGDRVDWYVNNDRAAASQLRHEFAQYIERHAAPGSDLLGAELIFSELLSNALDNSDQPVWVSLDWGAKRPVLSVNDLGTGFELPKTTTMPGPKSVRGRGLMIVTHLTDELEFAAKAAGGTRVRATLPIERPPTENIDPEPIPIDQLLPSPDEVDDDGRFGREPFLRALAVQIAQTVERDSGPATAERVVATVGMGVGQRIETAFRAARDSSDGPLTSAEMAELFVDLKDGIDGDFFVIDANDDRVILGNRRCPFGKAVTHAPALCRMTSSVFGGIASRNRGGAAVHLEERIAVGDPECRVTVWLRPPPEEIEPEVHFYGRMHPSDG